MSKIVNKESIKETETIDKFIDYMKIQADGLIDKEKPYWYNWALRQAFKAGIDYQKERGN